jgi:large subunit ribosomal protein L13
MGGLSEITLREQLERNPTRVIEYAVRGMLPKNHLGRQMIKRLKTYTGPEHPHQAQKPELMEI